MSKTIWLTAIALLVFFSCVSHHHAIYDISLSEVERPADAKERYGEQKIVSFEEQGKTKYSFQDEMVRIIWIPTSYQFSFGLTNKTKYSIKII